MAVLAVLPARMGSERLPGKPLRRIAGRTLVHWTWEAATRVEALDAVWVATDAPDVVEEVEGFGGIAVRTDPGHASGTDRVAEAAALPAARSFEIVVNYQADEPFLDASSVERTVAAVAEADAAVSTLGVPIRSHAEWRSPSVVKVVRARDGRALYFSRAPVPHPRDGAPTFPGDAGAGAPETEACPPPDAEAGPSPGETDRSTPGPLFLRHVGVYVYTRDALERWVELPPSPLEEVERLEQLRALEAGIPIHVALGPPCEPGIDVPGDLERAARLLDERDPRGRPQDG